MFSEYLNLLKKRCHEMTTRERVIMGAVPMRCFAARLKIQTLANAPGITYGIPVIFVDSKNFPFAYHIQKTIPNRGNFGLVRKRTLIA